MKRKACLPTFGTWCTLLLAGCTETVTEYHAGSDGRYHKVGTYTPDESWKRLVNERIAEEQAGTLMQKDKGRTVKQFWQGWYRGIRHSPTPAWKPSEFKTSEEMVAYIKRQRQTAGLPTYD